jgi:hypothetical protein
MSKVEAVVALATDSIVYAPLFIAAEAGFFDDLPIHFGVIRSVDGEDHVSRAVKSIWKAFASPELRPLITVCDPIHALLYNWLNRDSMYRQAIAGTLLKSPACWVFDHDHNLSRILRLVKSGKLAKVKTHPRGMTADTMTRWILLQRGRVAESDVDEMVDNQSTPGAELDDFRKPERWRNAAAVSVDYPLMYELQTTSFKKMRICEGIQRDAELRQYLQTVILTPTASLPGDVHKVQRGLHIALDLIAQNPEQAAAWLQRHYMGRLKQSVSLPSYLVPLANDVNVTSFPIGHLRAFLESGVFAPMFRHVDLKEALDHTWNIYQHANRRKLDEIAADYQQERPRRASEWLKRFKQPRRVNFSQRTIRRLLYRLSGRAIGEPLSEHTSLVRDWLRSLGGKLMLPAYSAVEFYLCASDDIRYRLKAVAQNFHGTLSNRQQSGRPYVVGLFGNSGAGKGAFVSALRRLLEREQSISNYAEITLGKLPRPQLESCILDIVNRLGPSASAARPLLIFVDEVNKYWDSYRVFLDYMLAHRTAEVVEAVDLRNIAWVFAGTIAADPEAAVNVLLNMSNESGGPDFAGRLSGTVMPVLPDLGDPLERVLRALMIVGGDVHAFPKPAEIEALALFWLGISPVGYPRQLDGRVFGGLSAMRSRGDSRLELRDIIGEEARSLVLATYGDFIGDLRDLFVTIDYGVNVEVAA